MALPSASSLHRAMVCPGSAVLPRVQNTSDEATRGTAIHAFLQATSKGDREEALKAVAEEYRPYCETLGENLPLGREYTTELGMLYDVETEKVRERAADAIPTDSEIGMRIDVAGAFNSTGVVIDYKTGRGWVPKARDNWQVRVAAVAFARWRTLESVQASIIRLREDGTASWDTAEPFDAWDLDTFAADLRVFRKRVMAERARRATGGADGLTLVMGDHCKYCPAFTHCPAQTGLIRRMALEPEGVANDLLALLTPETAAKAYERVKLVREAMKQVEAALHAYAYQTPIVLADGVVFGETETKREELDAEVVRRVLATLHGPEVADRACTFDTSKAGIERAVRAVYERRKAAGEKVTIKALMEEALETVREEGGAIVKTRRQLGEYKVA